MFARELRPRTRLLVAGGPLPSLDPDPFLQEFDAVVRGEGERTMCDLVAAFEAGRDIASLPGVAVAVRGQGGSIRRSEAECRRRLEADVDAIPFPARDLLPNARYIEHGRRRFGYAVTTLMSSRGCPFSCEFCSNAIFGSSYRERSVSNVLDELEEALALGYDRVHFADDVFTLRKERILALCDGIAERGLRFSWECLGRVDSIDAEAARAMRGAGCERIYFGIESGNKRVLGLMRKRITAQGAREAVSAAKAAGIQAGAFFILFYPGDNDDSVLETIGFASSLPLDYLSFTLPYPIPGTALYERLGDRRVGDWVQRRGLVSDHSLIFDADFSAAKMKFGLVKGALQFELERRLARKFPPAPRLFARATDLVLRAMR
jgi:anaerobic magnesium-protoporphyrin IX monomethyl ester cyclase